MNTSYQLTQETLQLNPAWLNIGLVQRDVPAHVVHEYCRPDRSFFPRPSFDEPLLSRISTVTDSLTHEKETWFSLAAGDNCGVGFDFSLLRSRSLYAEADDLQYCGDGIDFIAVSDDLAAVSYLDEVRSVDLTKLRKALMVAEPDQNLGMSS